MCVCVFVSTINHGVRASMYPGLKCIICGLISFKGPIISLMHLLPRLNSVKYCYILITSLKYRASKMFSAKYNLIGTENSLHSRRYTKLCFAGRKENAKNETNTANLK
jgi:hypothetical protein